MKHNKESDCETREGKYITDIIQGLEKKIKKTRKRGGSLAGSTNSHEPSIRLGRLVARRHIIRKLIEVPGSTNVTVVRNY